MFKKILPNIRGLFASTEFIEKHGLISDPDQLTVLPCIAYREEDFFSWELQNGSESKSIIPNYRMQTNNFWLARQAVLEGIGVATLPWVLCLSDIKKGNLVQVLPEWNHVLGDLYAVYPSRKYLSLTVRTFLDLVEELMVIPQKELLKRSPETIDKLSQLHLSHDGKLISSWSNNVKVSKDGLAEGLSDYSIEHPFLYGLLAALGAILAGYIGSEVFRRI